MLSYLAWYNVGMVQYLLEHKEVAILLIVWTLLWKGFALWRASRMNHKYWFVAIFIINTFGLLDILYIYVFSKKSSDKAEAGTTEG